MDYSEFTLAALRSFGATITQQECGLYLSVENGGREYVRFNDRENLHRNSTLYAPGSAAFLRLVSRAIATGVCEIEDLDANLKFQPAEIAQRCVQAFGIKPNSVEVEDVQRHFDGTSVVRVRATTAHDSYERLVDVPCSPSLHHINTGRSGFDPLGSTIEDPLSIGIDIDVLSDAAKLDYAISEFCRFYIERRSQEIQAAVNDERKKKKLEDEFTPRLNMTAVAIQGKMYRHLKLRARYSFDNSGEYTSTLTLVPHTGEITDTPKLGTCAITGRIVPEDCLSRCQISGEYALSHLLVQSEASSRHALPKHSVVCSLTGKRVLQDEVELSSITKNLVASAYLKTSALSGKRAEPSYFGQCAFTNTEVLSSELATSEISGKKYRIDEQTRSSVSGKTGHKQEFILCHATNQPLLEFEFEICEVTGNRVRRGLLEQCAITKKRVLPEQLERCAATGKRALKSLLVTSSLTQVPILEEVATRSAAGKFCAPIEAKLCQWSGSICHPDDLRVCSLTGLYFHFRFITTADGHPKLEPLVELLDGMKRTADKPHLWERINAQSAEVIQKGRCRVEAAMLSPDGSHLAVCCEVRTMLGFRVHSAGLIYSIAENSIVGRVTHGRRYSNRWVETKS